MKVKVAFASGTQEVNRALIDRLAAVSPELPLYVVAEFEPELLATTQGRWIPWHVYRSFGENLKAIRAELGARQIAVAHIAFAPGTAYRPMRVAAVRIAGLKLRAFDENLQPLAPAYFLRANRHHIDRAAKWIRRIAHPAEAAIPIRARLAQARGMSVRRRGTVQDHALQGFTPLIEGVTVVVPSRDGRELLAAMLPALLPQLYRGEVIVMDNGSADGTAAWLRDAYPQVRIIESATPLSFAHAVNKGIAEARHIRTLLLNNDMIVEPGFIHALVTVFDEIPDLYCATAQIFFPPGIRREETGKAVWRREGPLDFPVRCDDPYEGEDLTWVLYGSGGCSLFDTAKLREMGGVSEVYEPAYVEDMDFGYRAWKRGWPTVFRAGAKVEHRHRATTARFFTPRQIDFFVERNYLRFLIHAIGDALLFRSLWLEAVRRLQLLAMNGNDSAADALKDIPPIGPQPTPASGPLTEAEILALGNGDVACFPGHVRREGKTVLVASPCLPFPLSHGGAVRIFNLLKRTARDYNIVLLAFCDELATPPRELLDPCAEVVLIRRRGTHYKTGTARPDMVEEFESDTFRACLKQTAARWRAEIVQLEFTWMAQYAGAYPAAKTILVEHDITFDLKEQLLNSTRETGAALLEMRQQLDKWRRFETEAWSKVDRVVVMSDKDAATAASARTAVVPNGVDCGRFQPSDTEPEPKRLLFIGSFAHLPNLLALEFLLREVWPLLMPGYKLHIIAGPRPDYFRDFHRASVTIDLDRPFIECEGFVPDVREAYGRAQLVLAPLTASAGTNIKVLEAMAMGRVVIATAAGLNGLDLNPGQDVILVRDASAMAASIEALSANPAQRKTIELAARATALSQYDWDAIAQRQRDLYSDII